MVPSVVSDKFVLYIPADEISKSRERTVAEAVAEKVRIEELKISNSKTKGSKRQ
jgi:hypothetical protein